MKPWEQLKWEEWPITAKKVFYWNISKILCYIFPTQWVKKDSVQWWYRVFSQENQNTELSMPGLWAQWSHRCYYLKGPIVNQFYFNLYFWWYIHVCRLGCCVSRPGFLKRILCELGEAFKSPGERGRLPGEGSASSTAFHTSLKLGWSSPKHPAGDPGAAPACTATLGRRCSGAARSSLVNT